MSRDKAEKMLFTVRKYTNTHIRARIRTWNNEHYLDIREFRKDRGLSEIKWFKTGKGMSMRIHTGLILIDKLVKVRNRIAKAEIEMSEHKPDQENWQIAVDLLEEIHQEGFSYADIVNLLQAFLEKQ